jgi:hypothetical protein
MARTVTSHLLAAGATKPQQATGRPGPKGLRRVSDLGSASPAHRLPRKQAKVARPRRLEEEAAPVERVKAPGAQCAGAERTRKPREQRGKYLAGVVAALWRLAERRGSSRAAITARLQLDCPGLPWHNRPVIKRHLGLALARGLEDGVLLQQEYGTGRGSGNYRLSPAEVRRGGPGSGGVAEEAVIAGVEEEAGLEDVPSHPAVTDHELVAAAADGLV